MLLGRKTLIHKVQFVASLFCRTWQVQKLCYSLLGRERIHVELFHGFPVIKHPARLKKMVAGMVSVLPEHIRRTMLHLAFVTERLQK